MIAFARNSFFAFARADDVFCTPLPLPFEQKAKDRGAIGILIYCCDYKKKHFRKDSLLKGSVFYHNSRARRPVVQVA